MGYSCATLAGLAEKAMLEVLQQAGQDHKGTSNGWQHRYSYETYFFERGREQDDGAVTGSVWKNCMLNGKEFARRVGSVRIEPDGHIRWWRTSTAVQRRRATEIAYICFAKTYGADRLREQLKRLGK